MKTGVTVLLRNGHQCRFEGCSMEAWEQAMKRAADAHEQRPQAMNFLGADGEAMVRYDDVVAYWKS